MVIDLMAEDRMVKDCRQAVSKLYTAAIDLLLAALLAATM